MCKLSSLAGPRALARGEPLFASWPQFLNLSKKLLGICKACLPAIGRSGERPVELRVVVILLTAYAARRSKVIELYLASGGAAGGNTAHCSGLSQHRSRRRRMPLENFY